MLAHLALTDFGIVIPMTIVIVVTSILMMLVKQYKRCPPNRVLVVYGKTPGGGAGMCIHGGGVFVVPLIQDYAFLSLDPISFELSLPGLMTQDEPVDLDLALTVAISTDPHLMNNAAERLLGLSIDAIRKEATAIAENNVRVVVATQPGNQVFHEHERLKELIHSAQEPELNRIGLTVVSVGVRRVAFAQDAAAV